MEEFFPLLEGVLLFRGIVGEALKEVLTCLGSTDRRYPKGAVILRAGEPATHLGLVLAGQVQVSRLGADGSRQVMAAIGPGGLFGEAYACAGTQWLPVTAAAGVDSHVLLLDRARILAPCAAACPFHQGLIANLMAVLAQKNIQLSQSLEHLSKRTLREKLLSYLEEQAALAGKRRFVIPFDRQALADYLCVDRSALSRTIGGLRQEGVLEANHNVFCLR